MQKPSRMPSEYVSIALLNEWWRFMCSLVPVSTPSVTHDWTESGVRSFAAGAWANGLRHPFRVEAGTEYTSLRVRRGWICIDGVFAGWSPVSADLLSDDIAISAAEGWIVLRGLRASPSSWSYCFQVTDPSAQDAAAWQFPIALVGLVSGAAVVKEQVQYSSITQGAYL